MAKKLQLVALLVLCTTTSADPLTLPNTLSNNTPADAAAVQANFDALEAESNEDNSRINALEQNFTVDQAGSNTGAGIDALKSNTQGELNTAVGKAALTSNTQGFFNTAVGTDALLSNSTGGENTAVGAEALRANTTAIRNTAMGAAAMFNTTTGGENTATGYYALLDNTEGSQNTAAGAYALRRNTTGNQNIAVGFESLENNTTGSFNTALGFWALRAQTSGFANLAVGYRALFANTEGTRNAALGIDALQINTTGSNNVAVGDCALCRNETGNFNIAIGRLAGPAFGFSDLDNTIAIGDGAVVTESNTIRLGNTNVSDIFAQVGITTTSDARLKESIHSLDNGLALINDLNPVSYHRINNTRDDVELGLLAQEVAATLSKHGLENSGMVHQATPDSYMAVRYNDLLAPMIRAIQELDDAGDKKDAQIASLQEQLKSQQQRMLALLQAQQKQIARLEGIVAAEQVAAR